LKNIVFALSIYRRKSPGVSIKTHLSGFRAANNRPYKFAQIFPKYPYFRSRLYYTHKNPVCQTLQSGMSLYILHNGSPIIKMALACPRQENPIYFVQGHESCNFKTFCSVRLALLIKV